MLRGIFGLARKFAKKKGGQTMRYSTLQRLLYLRGLELHGGL
jgi:hypothetical protein